jgi:hypothetical protein
MDTQVNATYNDEMNLMESPELQQALSCAVIFSGIMYQSEDIKNLFGILFESAVASGFPVVQFVGLLRSMLLKFNPMPNAVPNGLVLIMSSLIYMISDMIEHFVFKSQKDTTEMKYSDFEEFRSIVIGQIGMIQNEQEK